MKMKRQPIICSYVTQMQSALTENWAIYRIPSWINNVHCFLNSYKSRIKQSHSWKWDRNWNTEIRKDKLLKLCGRYRVPYMRIHFRYMDWTTKPNSCLNTATKQIIILKIKVPHLSTQRRFQISHRPIFTSFGHQNTISEKFCQSHLN